MLPFAAIEAAFFGAKHHGRKYHRRNSRAAEGGAIESDDIIKTFAAPGSATTGLQAYNLEARRSNCGPSLRRCATASRASAAGSRRRRTGRRSRTSTPATRAPASPKASAAGPSRTLCPNTFAAFRGYGLETASPLKRSTRPRDLRISRRWQPADVAGDHDPGGALDPRRQYERRLGNHANAVAGRIGLWRDAGRWNVERYRRRAVAASVSRCRRRQ